MTQLYRIDNVDLVERQRQQLLTAALWAELMKQRIEVGAVGRVECCFVASTSECANAVARCFPEWKHTIAALDKQEQDHVVLIETPSIHVTKEALLELVDVAMKAAEESSCKFNGFEIETSSLKRRPWWKVW